MGWRDFWCRKDVNTYRASMAYHQKQLRAGKGDQEKHMMKFWQWQALFLEQRDIQIQQKPKKFPIRFRRPTRLIFQKRTRHKPATLKFVKEAPPPWVPQPLSWD